MIPRIINPKIANNVITLNVKSFKNDEPFSEETLSTKYATIRPNEMPDIIQTINNIPTFNGLNIYKNIEPFI